MSRRPVHSRRPPIWVADDDGLAHARAHLISPRTACGITAIPERYAYPSRVRCAVCTAVLMEVAIADC